MKIEKLGEDLYRISTAENTIDFDKERYEDLFYAVPLDTTSFYRLLTESVCESEDQRKVMVSMIQSLDDMESGLKGLMDRIVALGN